MKSSGKIITLFLLIAIISTTTACSSGNSSNGGTSNRVPEEGATSFAENVKKLNSEQEKGSFVIQDGVDTYMEQGQVVIDKLVKVGGKLYYVDDKGHKVKNQWAIIDNDGNYGYFGSLGELVINKIRVIDGKEYYFDENGVLYQDRTEKKVKVIDGVEYIANKNGELRLASDPEPTTTATTVAPTTRALTQSTTISAQQAAAQQAAQQQAAQQAAAQQAAAQQAAQQAAAQQAATSAPFSNAININQGTNTSVPNEFGGPGVTGNNTSAYTTQTVAPTTQATNTAQSASEVKVSRTEKIIETVDGDDYECKITLLKPIMLGTSEEETMNLNAAIDEVTDVWMEEVMSLVNGYTTLPKSVTFTSVDLGTVTKSKVTITITGNIRPKSGSSKSIKYRITYAREDGTANISKISG